ncbi:MauE/DoxX family redox-associated membrane protein [Gimibacter soli]|uniref:Methylamine utilization protein MauE n=1 Tax=Gimibacter soli TaxID=3024400 RepID=A0AAF0BLQ5_9PROT|nr:MauE/DoxX family redox-associated membrane protein [Gimibacter soli]WCL53401.1 hypothetical protein PH603_12715 [Gimibacter soli]
MDPLFHLVIAAFILVLCAHAGITKLAHPERLLPAARVLSGLPEKLLVLALPALGILEIVIGVSLFMPVVSPYAAIAAALLFLGYGLLIARQLARGNRHFDCGCSLISSPRKTETASRHVARNLVLVAGAVLLLIPVASRTLVWFDFLNGLFGLAALLCLYMTFDALAALNPAHGRKLS